MDIKTCKTTSISTSRVIEGDSELAKDVDELFKKHFTMESLAPEIEVYGADRGHAIDEANKKAEQGYKLVSVEQRPDQVWVVKMKLEVKCQV